MKNLGIVCLVAACIAASAHSAGTSSANAWEYRCERAADDDRAGGDAVKRVNSQFTALGTEGWELAGTGWYKNELWCFKRRK